MCGVVGYAGERAAAPVLLAALRRLEYRGYDSAGLAIQDSGSTWSRVRAVGNVDALEAAVAKTNVPGTTGVGHTRWATHGAVTRANAHPFAGCRGTSMAAVNGIIENSSELRAELEARNHVFESDTDSEVVVHLLEEQDGAFAQSLARVAARLEGHFALVVSDVRHPGLVAGTRRHVPLLVGLAPGESLVASSLDALAGLADRALLLEEGEVGVIDANGAVLTDAHGAPVHREELVVDPVADEPLGRHATRLAAEIHQQPQALARTISGRTDGGRVRLDGPGLESQTLAGVRRVELVGCGSAFQAATAALPMFRAWSGIPAEARVASEWRDSAPQLGPNDLVVLISQSGETADTLAAARLARARGAQTIAITNMDGSQLTHEVAGLLLTRAGVERSVAASKTFTAQLAALALMALHLGDARGHLDAAEAEAAVSELELIPAKVEEVLRRFGKGWSDHPILSELVEARFAILLGRQQGLAVAHEAALKLRELAYLPCEAYPTGELKHGPFALLEAGLPVICLATASAVDSRLESSVREVLTRGASVIAITSDGDTTLSTLGVTSIGVPHTHPLLEPLLAIVPLQLLAHDVAQAAGHHVDQPRNLAKTVTVE